MLFKTHLVVSLAVYFLILGFIEIPSPFLFLIFVLLGGIIVDIDSVNSFIGRRFYFRPIQWITRHRGIFHSLFFAILLSLIISSFNHFFGFGFLVGYLSHLFLDCLTKSGVALFYPISSLKISFGLKSGGIIEQVIFVLFLLLDIFLVGKLFLNSLF